MENKKNKHLSLDDRIEIQQCLDHKMTFKAIAARIGKDQTTVSKEVKKHLEFSASKVVHRDKQGNEVPAPVCPILLKSPFVCNACEKKGRANCKYLRQIYLAKYAQKEYEGTLVESRTGVALNREEFYETEKVISTAIRNGQHIYHAIKSNDVSVSVSTVYRHINKQYYSIGVLDLPRAVKFKPRKTLKDEKIPKCLKIGRSYDDFLDFVEENGEIPLVELDTVIGKVGGKVIMTIHFINSNFMIRILLENKTVAEAASKVQKLKSNLLANGYTFADFVPVLLTDNGGEFSFVKDFENNPDGEPETKLFFCEPCSPQEKPHIEKNHTLFRDIVPKGSSFDDFTQDTVNMIFSHVNAVKRKQFNGKSAYDMFSFYYSQTVASAFGICMINSKDVIQSPKLLKNISHS